MRFILYITLISMLFIQGITGLEADVSLDAQHYYQTCLENLELLPFTHDYSQTLKDSEINLAISNKHASVKEFVAKLAEEILQRPVSPEEVVSLNGAASQGQSGNPVFKVGALAKAQIVVKVFKEKSGAFSKEFLTLYTYNQSPLSSISLPKMHAAAATEIKGSPISPLACNLWKDAR